MKSKRRWTDDELRAAVSTSSSYREVQDKIGSRSGGGHYDIRTRIRELALDTSHFRSRSAPAPWSMDDFVAAVSRATSHVDVLVKLGLEPTSALETRVRRTITELGLDVSHYTRKQTGGVARWTDDELREAVTTSRSMASVLRKLRIVPRGGNYRTIGAHIARLGLSTGHFTGQPETPRRHVPPVPLAEVLVADRPTGSQALKQRLFAAGLKSPACERCGWAERAPDGRLPLELDHSNGDPRDNRLENLRILCPNCHSLQPTHRGLNRRKNLKRQQ